MKHESVQLFQEINGGDTQLEKVEYPHRLFRVHTKVAIKINKFTREILIFSLQNYFSYVCIWPDTYGDG